MVTDYGATAVNMQYQTGILAIGFDKPNTTSCYNPIVSLVYLGTNGKLCKKPGRYMD